MQKKIIQLYKLGSILEPIINTPEVYTMPITSLIEDDFELKLIKCFYPEAFNKLLQALEDGKKVEKIESSILDEGDDFVSFNIDGVEIFRIVGY